LIRFRARSVLPISTPPIDDGWIAIENGRISATGGGPVADGVPEVDLGSVALLPDLVNAHTHLELSYLRGQVPAADAFVAWIQGVIGARRARPDPNAPEIVGAVHDAIAEALRCGTAAVGDISNTLVTFDPLAASPLAAVVFYELIRFNATDAAAIVNQALRQVSALPSSDRVRISLAAHAPYSVSPLVFRAIREAVDHQAHGPYSVHLSESAAEVEFIRNGTGPWRSFLDDVGAWNPEWRPHGASPVDYLDACGFLSAKAIVVHGVQMSDADLARLAGHDATLVTCPRSNVRTGAGIPPVARFYQSGVRVAIGTDSLASTPDLNVFAELAELRQLAPTVPASRLLESATRHGARALGFDADYGTIEPGKRARLLAVSVPDDADDVEEYLVSGIEPAQVHWVSQGAGSRE